MKVITACSTWLPLVTGFAVALMVQTFLRLHHGLSTAGDHPDPGKSKQQEIRVLPQPIESFATRLEKRRLQLQNSALWPHSRPYVEDNDLDNDLDYELQHVERPKPPSPASKINMVNYEYGFVQDELDLVKKRILVAIIVSNLDVLATRTRTMKEWLKSHVDRVLVFVNAAEDRVRQRVSDLSDLVIDRSSTPPSAMNVLLQIGRNGTLANHRAVVVVPDTVYLQPQALRRFLEDFGASDQFILGVPADSPLHNVHLTMCDPDDGVIVSHATMVKLVQEADSKGTTTNDGIWGTLLTEDRGLYKCTAIPGLGEHRSLQSQREAPRPDWTRTFFVPNVTSVDQMKDLHFSSLRHSMVMAQQAVLDTETLIARTQDHILKGLEVLSQATTEWPSSAAEPVRGDQFAWPPGTSSTASSEAKVRMDEEWVSFNRTHYFPVGLEAHGWPLPDQLRGQIEEVLALVKSSDRSPLLGCTGSAVQGDLRRGWLLFEPARGIEYQLLLEDGRVLKLFRELSPVPKFLPTPQNKEEGLLNLLVPYQADEDEDKRAGLLDLLGSLKAIHDFKYPATFNKNRMVYLHVAVFARSHQNFRRVFGDFNATLNVDRFTSRVKLWWIKSDHESGEEAPAGPRQDPPSLVVKAVDHIVHQVVHRRLEVLNRAEADLQRQQEESLWLWLRRPLGLRLQVAHFVELVNRVLLNTVFGRQVFCIVPFVKYHPAVLRRAWNHLEMQDRLAKNDPSLAGYADLGHFSMSEADEAVAFHLGDYIRARSGHAESSSFAQGRVRACDLFRIQRPRLQRPWVVLEAPDPAMVLEYDNGTEATATCLEDPACRSEWAKGLGPRSVLNRMLDEGWNLDDDDEP